MTNLQHWKNKYYKINVSDFNGKLPTRQNLLKVLDHAINKWIGLKKVNLKKYQLLRDGEHLLDDNEYFSVNCDTCSLCQMFSDSCSECPLSHQSDHRCYRAYNAFVVHGKTSPMLNRLNNAKKYILKNKYY
jgi:hypothetical protein